MTGDRDLLEAVVERLQRLRAESGGRLPDGELGMAARVIEVPKPTLSQWVTNGLPTSDRAMPRFSLVEDEDARAVVYEVNRSRAASRRRLAAERGEENVPTERTIQRAYRRDFDRGEQAAVERGDAGWRSHRPTERYEAEYRNQHWHADHTCLEVSVKPPGKNRKSRRPWMTTFEDAYSRAIMGYCVSLRPNQGHVLAALRSAVTHSPERGPFRGVPGWITTDRGMEFVADAVTEALLMMQVTAMPTLPRHPQHNGKVERLHGSIASVFLADLPGFLDGAKDLRNRPVSGAFDLPLDVFLAELARWVDYYNLQRPHRALDGLTPAEAFEADGTPLSSPPDALLRRYLLKGLRRVVRRGVIVIDNHEYIADNWIEGEVVDVGIDPNDMALVEVYRGDEWLDTAERKTTASQGATDDWIAHNEELAERHRRDRARARKRSARRYGSMIDGSPSVETTPPPPPGASSTRSDEGRRAARDRALSRLDE